MPRPVAARKRARHEGVPGRARRAVDRACRRAGGAVLSGAHFEGLTAEHVADRLDSRAQTTANVISTAGDAALSVSPASPGGLATASLPGHLANGAFSLPEALRVEIAPASWTGPVSNANVAITFRRHVGASDALRTGSYSGTLTFTLSTTRPLGLVVIPAGGWRVILRG